MVACTGRLKRAGASLLLIAAGGSTTLPSVADTGCGLGDVTRYQTALIQPAEEATPVYIQQTAEDFIRRCPDRFETREAHLVAARGALDAGEAVAAVTHYDNALARGARLSPVQRLDQSIALLAAGRTRDAVEVRNLAVNDWLVSLADHDVTQVDMRKSKGGIILAVNFNAVTQGAPVRALWLAIPDGPGLPAAAILRADPVRASLRALRTGREASALTILEHRSCRDARILRETQQPAAVESFDRAASEAMRAYLRKPDRLGTSAPGEPLPSCLMPELMLPVPKKAL